MYDFKLPPAAKMDDSLKWHRYAEDVLPLWIADMDFAAPPAVIDALQSRAATGFFGYSRTPLSLLELICARLWRLYRWQVTPDEIVLLPNLVSGLNLACRTTPQAGDGVIVQTPIYPPFLSAPTNQQRRLQLAPLAMREQKGFLHYEIDEDVLNAALTPESRLFLLCHPHNPAGRAFSTAELETLANFCLRHDLVLCSDEVHAELLFDGRQHTPVATLSAEIAERCITLLAPSKAFNIAGLGFSFAVIQNTALRQRFEQAASGLIGYASALTMQAALAVYRGDCDDWLQAVLVQLADNRTLATDFLREHLPAIRCTLPEATYLLWLDGSALHWPTTPADFLLEQGRLALNPGHTFGPGYEHCFRLNFACSHETLTEALQRLHTAVQHLDV